MLQEKTKNIKENKKEKKKILKILGLLFLGIILTYIFILKPVFSTWGATTEEFNAGLPGDEIVPTPKTNITRAITINAAPENIYPWLVQMGINKGGLYSYDWLENLFGLNVHSEDFIVKKWQNPEIGEQLLLGPMGGPKIMAMKKNEYLVFGGSSPELTSIWTFHLIKVKDNTTRLIIRSRNQYPNSIANFIIWKVITEPLHFIMEEKMMRGIRERAENTRKK
jgi:hypothetical protein